MNKIKNSIKFCLHSNEDNGRELADIWNKRLNGLEIAIGFRPEDVFGFRFFRRVYNVCEFYRRNHVGILGVGAILVSLIGDIFF